MSLARLDVVLEKLFNITSKHSVSPDPEVPPYQSFCDSPREKNVRPNMYGVGQTICVSWRVVVDFHVQRVWQEIYQKNGRMRLVLRHALAAVLTNYEPMRAVNAGTRALLRLSETIRIHYGSSTEAVSPVVMWGKVVSCCSCTMLIGVYQQLKADTIYTVLCSL